MPDKTIQERLDVDGYAILSDQELAQAIDIAETLGKVTMDRRSPEPYRRISPQALEAAKANTLSSRYGMDAFPFHTDVAHWRQPARYSLLYCENPGSGNRPTELVDTWSWRMDKPLRHSIVSSLWKSGHKSPMLCTIGNEVNGALAIRYDTGCMRPASTNSELLKVKIEGLIKASTKVTIPWVSSLLMLIDNTRMLHARGSAASPDRDRVLIRILVGGYQ